MDECEVIVIGAGPTGLMCASLLVRNGVRVRVFDKNPDQAHESRALAVQSRSLELFLSLGLSEELVRRGTFVSAARLYVDGAPRVELHFNEANRPDTPFPHPLSVSQRDTEAILNDDLKRRGVSVERSAEVIALTQDKSAVIARVKGANGDEFEVRAAYAVGADGAHSITRKALGLSFEGAAYPDNFLLADCRVDGLPHPDEFGIFLHEKQFAAFIPLPGEGQMGRIIARDPDGQGEHGESENKQGGRDASLAKVEEAFCKATNLPVKLSDSKWTSLYRVHHRGVDRYRVGRAFVAGDAAHIHSPAGGQGMNTGLQDAANLAWKLTLALRGASAQEALLDSYHDERWPIGQRVLHDTDRMFTTMTSADGWFAAFRNAALPVVAGAMSHLSVVRERALNFISELGIHYECREEKARPATHFWKYGPGVGHRAPNALFARGRDVFELLSGYGFHVLAFSDRRMDGRELDELAKKLDGTPRPPSIPWASHIISANFGADSRRILRPETGAAFAAYGLNHETRQALYLVRPDGYVAWRADSLDVDGLGRYVRASLL